MILPSRMKRQKFGFHSITAGAQVGELRCGLVRVLIISSGAVLSILRHRLCPQDHLLGSRSHRRAATRWTSATGARRATTWQSDPKLFIADLAGQVQHHACQGDAEPIWAPPGSHPSTALIGEITVWRAANGINPQDPRPTGGKPTRKCLRPLETAPRPAYRACQPDRVQGASRARPTTHRSRQIAARPRPHGRRAAGLAPDCSGHSAGRSSRVPEPVWTRSGGSDQSRQTALVPGGRRGWRRRSPHAHAGLRSFGPASKN